MDNKQNNEQKTKDEPKKNQKKPSKETPKKANKSFYKPEKLLLSFSCLTQNQSIFIVIS